MKRKRRRESGQTTAFYVGIMVLVFGFMALAIDLGLIFHGRRLAQNAADPAALAGAAELLGCGSGEPDVIRAAANKYAHFNLDHLKIAQAGPDVVSTPGILTPPNGFQVGNANWPAVFTRVDRDQAYIFGRFLGLLDQKVGASAMAVCGAISIGGVCPFYLKAPDPSAPPYYDPVTKKLVSAYGINIGEVYSIKVASGPGVFLGPASSGGSSGKAGPRKPPTNTPKPTNTRNPTNTPNPTHTPVPTSTLVPTNTPPPGATFTPTPTPKPGGGNFNILDIDQFTHGGKSYENFIAGGCNGGDPISDDDTVETDPGDKNGPTIHALEGQGPEVGLYQIEKTDAVHFPAGHWSCNLSVVLDAGGSTGRVVNASGTPIPLLDVETLIDSMTNPVSMVAAGNTAPCGGFLPTPLPDGTEFDFVSPPGESVQGRFMQIVMTSNDANGQATLDAIGILRMYVSCWTNQEPKSIADCSNNTAPPGQVALYGVFGDFLTPSDLKGSGLSDCVLCPKHPVLVK